MRKFFAVYLLLFAACVVEGSSLQSLVLNDDGKAPEILILRTSKIVKLPENTKTRDALTEFAKKQQSPVAFFDAQDGMIGFVGANGLAFMDKSAARKLRTMKAGDALQDIHRNPMMESADFSKKYSVKPRPKWPDKAVKLSEDMMAVFLEKKPSKYVVVDSVDRVYVLELGSLAINKKGIKLKVHTNNAFIKEQGMHSVGHLGYPGAFYLYPREEWYRTHRPDGVVSFDEMTGMYKSRKSPVLYWDEKNDGKFGVVGSKQIMFINSTAFSKLVNPRYKARPSLNKAEEYKYEKVFQQAKLVSVEEYKQKYELVVDVKQPYPTIPVQVAEHIQFIFLKSKVSDYLMIRTFNDRTFVVQFIRYVISDPPEVPNGKKEQMRFKIFEIE